MCGKSIGSSQVGAHSQIEESLAEKGLPPPPFHEGMRVTDEATMRVVQEQCGVTKDTNES